MSRTVPPEIEQFVDDVRVLDSLARDYFARQVTGVLEPSEKEMELLRRVAALTAQARAEAERWLNS